MTWALVLGGGGVRGAFQAGVWQALATAGFSPRFVIGSSIGALNGAATARLAPEALVAWWQDPRLDHFRAYQLSRTIKEFGGAILATPVQQPWPTLAVATDLKRRRPVVNALTDRTTLDRLCASCSLPGVTRPVTINGTRYADGGLVNDLPIDIARDLGATKILAISAAGLGPQPAAKADRLLTPPEPVGRILDFSRGNRQRLLQAGQEAGQRLCQEADFLAGIRGSY
ncbi:patatin-like phospholipase family protein [Lacticaseibacillus mingshuiensis]|uniref:patatin-like phospholipase family protein n=1 Tax=Lacticaseibacillus mingshuiensis TaxID=2799574 RepID=UPI0019520D99|nr:patatin-like phospholipase family protein [Lacticaseibacillus mingshuiensis]